MAFLRLVLIAGSATLVLWYAAGLACARLGQGMPSDVSAAPDGENGILYVVGPEVKRLDLETGDVQTLLRTNKEVLRVLRDGTGHLVFEARAETPKGRPTIQPFVASSGKLVALLPSDESTRSGLSMVEGMPTYVKKTEWRGAFGGTPWGGEGALCQVVEGKERTAFAPLRRTAEADSTTYGATLPVSYFDTTGNGSFVLALVDTRTGKRHEVGRFDSIFSPALSPDGSRVAFSQGLYTVVEVDATTGRTLADHSVNGRVIGVFYAPGGDLLCLVGEANAGRADLLHLRGGHFRSVATLR